MFQVVETDGNLVQAVDLLRIAIKKSLEIDGELDIIVNLVLGRHLARRFVIDDLIAVLCPVDAVDDAGNGMSTTFIVSDLDSETAFQINDVVIGRLDM